MLKLGIPYNTGTRDYADNISIRVLADLVDIEEDFFLICGYQTDSVRRRLRRFKRENPNGIVINEGFPKPFSGCTQASNKLLTKQLLRNTQVPTMGWIEGSKLVLNGQFRPNQMSLNYPIVAKLIKGKGGEGMCLIHSVEELRLFKRRLVNATGSNQNAIIKISQEYFFEEAFAMEKLDTLEETVKRHVEHTREYRVVPVTYGTHKQNCFRILRKRSNGENFGRNLGQGTYFARPSDEDIQKFWPASDKRPRPVQFDSRDLEFHALKAVQALNLNVAAVDIGFDTLTGRYNVYEINMCPSMGTEENSYTKAIWQLAMEVIYSMKKMY